MIPTKFYLQVFAEIVNKLEKVIKLKKWTSNIFNSNEKKVKACLKEIIPNYKNLVWDEENFLKIYISVLNSLPARYKQKNSIEISGKIRKQIIKDAIIEKIEEVLNE